MSKIINEISRKKGLRIMEKIQDMQNAQVPDSELEQVSGGGKLFEQFKEMFGKISNTYNTVVGLEDDGGGDAAGHETGVNSNC